MVILNTYKTHLRSNLPSEAKLNYSVYDIDELWYYYLNVQKKLSTYFEVLKNGGKKYMTGKEI